MLVQHSYVILCCAELVVVFWRYAKEEFSLLCPRNTEKGQDRVVTRCIVMSTSQRMEHSRNRL